MLHAIYRSYGGDNNKPRPPYYSKLLALASFVRAVESAAEAGVGIEVLFVNDGPIAADLLALMSRSGEVVQRYHLGNQGSLRFAMGLPEERSWADDDVVWLAEDDYLYLPESLANLAEATGTFREADYFALYASIGPRTPWGTAQPDYAPVPADWRASEPVMVNGRRWQRMLSSTATLGARVRALREDQWLINLALRSRGTWDHTMCLMLQGLVPFPWDWLARDLRRALEEHGASRLARQTALAAIRSGLNLGQGVRRLVHGAKPPRTMMACDPPLICHLDPETLAYGTDWTEVAYDVARWAAERCIPVTLESRAMSSGPVAAAAEPADP